MPPVDAEPRTTGRAKDAERRRYVVIAAVMALAIIGLALVTGLVADDPPRSERSEEDDTAAKPHIIPRPGSGRAPDDPGDRGGWQQMAVLAVMVGGIATIGVLVWRSGTRARRSAPATSQKPGEAP